MTVQDYWKWCNKCQGLFFGGNLTPGVCPAGGGHSQQGSDNYELIADDPSAIGQDDWRWCNKCQGLFFVGNPAGPCPAGEVHDLTGSNKYTIY